MNDSSTMNMPDGSTMPSTNMPTTTTSTNDYPTQPDPGYYSSGTTNSMYGQNSYSSTPASPAAILMAIIAIAIVYIYFALVLYKIAKKTFTPKPGLAWVPIVGIYTFVKSAGKPGWWFILLFIPLVNIVIAVIIWMEISRRLNKPDYLGLLMLIPLVNIIIPGYLAFSNSAVSINTPPATPTPPASI